MTCRCRHHGAAWFVTRTLCGICVIPCGFCRVIKSLWRTSCKGPISRSSWNHCDGEKGVRMSVHISDPCGTHRLRALSARTARLRSYGLPTTAPASIATATDSIMAAKRTYHNGPRSPLPALATGELTVSAIMGLIVYSIARLVNFIKSFIYLCMP